MTDEQRRAVAFNRGFNYGPGGCNPYDAGSEEHTIFELGKTQRESHNKMVQRETEKNSYIQGSLFQNY